MTVANRQAEAQIRQAELARRDHVAELFNRAAGQLRDDKLEVRLAAIFQLDQICRDFADLADPVLKLLAAYLRENPDLEAGSRPPADIAEIIQIVRRWS